MSDVDTLKAEIKKLSARAMHAKMNLHDLSEELPIGLGDDSRRGAKGAQGVR